MSKGHSLKEIATMTGVAHSTIREHLIQAGVTLRKKRPDSPTVSFRQSYKSSAAPPFAYCYLEGRVQKDPREYPVLMTIKQQWRLGKNPTEIARYLNSRKFKTRTGKLWKQPTVYYIIQRLNTSDQEKQR